MATKPDQTFNNTPRNHAETIRELTVQAQHNPVYVDVEQPKNGQRQFIMVPRDGGGYDAKEVTPEHTLPAPRPTYVHEAVEVQDQTSLVDYVNRFKNNDTIMFANLTDSTIFGAIDYHRRPADAENDRPSAELISHSVRLDLPYSEEWNIWTAIDGRLLNQLEFVRFLEENAVDVKAPATADLIEVCRDIQGLRSVEFTSVVRADSNNAEKFHYADASGVKGKGDVDIPKEFKLEIPVYFNDRPYEVRALLRHEIDDGKLKLGIKLWRREYVRQTAFRNIMAGVNIATSVDVLFGRLPNHE